jgi:FKBP-type peptidyl-prolyl cis-trans isomerase FklB
MKPLYWTTFLLFLVSITLFVTSCQNEKKQRVLQTQNEKVSYAIGFDVGKDIAEQDMKLNAEFLLRGIGDGFSGSAPALSDAEIKTIRANFLEQRKTAMEKERQEAALKNREDEKVFLAANSKKEGVVTLPSGLQYRIITPGSGAQPSIKDNVKVHYRGYFIDGSEFENSYAEDQPAVFPVARVIPGWTEALQLMKEGAKWELFVPSELAYGEEGAGKIIGPGKTLIFEIELIGIH